MTVDRRAFIRTSAAAAGAAALSANPALAAATTGPSGAPAVHARRTRVRPVVISDLSGIRFRNGGPENALERAFRGITEGEDVLDALIAGVNIPELDPEESGIGYGGLPNERGVVQLDSCCMHGPYRQAGGVAALEGVRMPSQVARAVMRYTDHHLLVGQGAQDFARNLGFSVEEDLNTETSRRLWLEWRRRVDPGHWLDPEERLKGGKLGEETDPDLIKRSGGGPGSVESAGRPGAAPGGFAPEAATAARDRADRHLAAGLSMVKDGLIPEHSFWGTINCDGISPDGDICGVTTTSGLAWKIPGRAGDSPILGAGLYVDNDVGAAGSTGRGEANLYNLSSFLIVENMRRGMAPKDAGMEALRRIRDNTVEARLLNSRGLPAFDVRFFILNKAGEYAGVAMYGTGESLYGVCTENGAQEMPLEGLLEGPIRD
jgi:N4-(beta-N-acetylglucosaminyl)-L-asparaginase